MAKDKEIKYVKVNVFDKKYWITVVLFFVTLFIISFVFVKNDEIMIVYYAFNILSVIVSFVVPLCIRIVQARIETEDKYIEILGIKTFQLGEPIGDYQKQKKSEILRQYFASSKKQFRKAKTIHKIIYILSIILYAVICLICIFCVPGKKIPTWFFPLITHTMVGYARSVPQYALILFFTVIGYALIKIFTIGLEEKFSNIFLWIFVMMVMVPVAIRMLYENFLISAIALGTVFMIVYLSLFFINRGLKKRGRRLPGGFEITK